MFCELSIQAKILGTFSLEYFCFPLFETFIYSEMTLHASIGSIS